MADAESNLVPSEAADQVEVALEAQAAADDGILYLNEYQYENDLVTDFARLVASPRRRGSLYVAAAIAALIGIGMLVAGGNYEMIVGSGSVLGNVDEKFLTHSIPFLFESYDEAASYMDGTGGEYYTKLMAEKGIVYMSGMYNGLRQLTTQDVVVDSPEDLSGLRIRVPSGEVYMRTLTDMGGDPVAMNWSENFTALQQGTLDGHANGYQTIYSANIQEVQNCITVWNWSFDGYWFMANQKDWDKMDPAVQELLMEKAQEAAQWGRDKLVADEKQIKEDFIASGITITELTPEQHQAFVDAARPAQEYFMEKFGAEACTAWGLE